MIAHFVRSMGTSNSAILQDRSHSGSERPGGDDGQSRLCSNCHRVLQELRVQADDEDEIRCSEEFDIDLKSLRSSRDSHCYICSTIWLEMGFPKLADEKFLETTVINLEYLLHQQTKLPGYENPLEFRVNAMASSSLDGAVQEAVKLFILHPAQSKPSLSFSMARLTQPKRSTTLSSS